MASGGRLATSRGRPIRPWRMAKADRQRHRQVHRCLYNHAAGAEAVKCISLATAAQSELAKSCQAEPYNVGFVSRLSTRSARGEDDAAGPTKPIWPLQAPWWWSRAPFRPTRAAQSIWTTTSAAAAVSVVCASSLPARVAERFERCWESKSHLSACQGIGPGWAGGLEPA